MRSSHQRWYGLMEKPSDSVAGAPVSSESAVTSSARPAAGGKASSSSTVAA